MTGQFDKLSHRLHPQGISYAGFDPRGVAHKLEGWGSTHPWFAEAVRELRPATIIEVGSWLGGSSIYMGNLLRELALDSCVICVDTWLGDRQLWSRPQHRLTLDFHWGRPEVYHAFLANVHEVNLQELLLPLPMHSTGAARYLRDLEISASLIYIDGSHDAGDVYADLTLYWELLEPGGIMLIDDYVPNTNHNEMFWGLIEDTQRFVRQRGLELEALERKARIRKPIS